MEKKAVPSVFQQFPKYLQASAQKQKSLMKHKMPEKMQKVPFHSNISKFISADRAYAISEVLHQTKVCNKLQKLQRKVKALTKKVQQKEKNIKNMKTMFASLKEKQLVMAEQFVTLNKTLVV